MSGQPVDRGARGARLASRSAAATIARERSSHSCTFQSLIALENAAAAADRGGDALAVAQDCGAAPAAVEAARVVLVEHLDRDARRLERRQHVELVKFAFDRYHTDSFGWSRCS